MALAILAGLGILVFWGTGNYIEVSPDSLGMAPDDYIGVEVKLKCRFVKLDSTWLGDSEVFRSSQDYVGFSVLAGERIFAQLFAPRILMSELDRLDKGDRLIIYGKVFSSRYNFPWIDVERFSEGWVVGEEPERVRKERREMARNYEDFLKSREGVLEEIDIDELRTMKQQQQALINLLIKKGVITSDELSKAKAAIEVAPSPVPPWQRYLQGGAEEEK